MFVGRDVYFLYSQVAQFGGVQFSTSTKSFSQYLQRNDICIMLKLPPNISVEICVFKVSVMSEVHAYAMFRCAFLSQLLDAPNTASFV